MGGLMTALALRQSGVFSSIDVYEQTKEPTTAGAGFHHMHRLDLLTDRILEFDFSSAV
jgi:2-polyprenyl-6-methoxyphenol hydroxylase-like FAD-dependent oxidoreductase